MDLRLALHLFLLLRFVTSYDLPRDYFINCGSDSPATLFTKTYSPDLKSDPTSALHISNSSLPLLYQTARLFFTGTLPKTAYQFPITQNATHILRLHFQAFFSANLNLSDAKFHVSIPPAGTMLLYNFTVPTGSTVIEEFLLPPIHSQLSTLTVDFTPAEGSPLAFVNAIEAFPAPDSLLRRSPYPNGHVLRKVYRINMGGGVLTPENDTLNRYWEADDGYLHIADAAMNSEFRSAEPVWNTTLSDPFIAPPLVYQTAKELNMSFARLANSFNATWKLDVVRNAVYLVRAHFCNIMGASINDIWFNFFIDGFYATQVVPWKITYDLAVPFYMDFVVDSDQSGVMNISIGSLRESQKRTAFLNGLEVWELMVATRFGNRGQLTRRKTFLVVVVVGGVLLIVILFLGLFFGLYGRKMKRRWRENDGIGLVEASASDSPLLNYNLGLKIPITEIACATNNFDASLMIGEGGFGKVYKGALQDGTKVAVKRSEPEHGQGLPEFQTEIIVLSKIQHVHLVSLIGYCNEMSEMILVYEFMEKGTLREHLYGNLEKSRPKLSWEKRLEICIGSARGLHYLHAGAVGGIIHRDVKSTNILLDGNYVAKVADFGLSSVLLDQSHVSTGIKGSFGYLDPEYFRTMQLTQKSDVYSFGVVLLEVGCARQVIKNSERNEEINLAEWGMLWHKKGQLEKIIDPFLVGKVNPNSLRVFGETAAKCLRDDGVDRPTMGEVIWDLEYSLQLQNTAAPGERDTSFDLQMKMVVPSHSMKMDEHISVMFSHNETSASDIFSQLRFEGAR